VKRLSRDEFITEVEWLLDGGVHPAHVAHALRIEVGAVERRLYRYGMHDLARLFRYEARVVKRVAA
jgi:hypothetical protein